MAISRRTVIIGSGLLGAVAAVGGWGMLADARLVPGRGVVDRVLRRCIIDAAPAVAAPGELVRGSFHSLHRNQNVRYVLSYPPTVAPGANVPVCLVLHGLGGDEATAFDGRSSDGLGYHRIAAAAALPPFVLASVEGGDGYWHPREGDDPLGMVLEEFPSVLRRHGLRTDRFALFGWSMGGFGALLAATEAPQRVACVVANAPAIWRSYEEARSIYATAFTSADDWRRYGDLSQRLDRLPARVRIDCGESDSFAPAIEDLRDRLPDPSVVHIRPGCHDFAFWRSVAGEQLAMVGQALS